MTSKRKLLQSRITKAREMQLYCLKRYLQTDWPDHRGAGVGLDDWVFEEILAQEELMKIEKQEKMIRHLEREKQNITGYHNACERGLKRVVSPVRDFNDQAVAAFKAGLGVAEGTPILGNQGLEVETNFSFAFVCGLLCRLEAVKGKSYLASWMKRGYYGIKANLDRKWDRLEVIFEEIEDEGIAIAGEGLVTQCADLSVYALKLITLRAQQQPTEFQKWIDEIVSIQDKEDIATVAKSQNGSQIIGEKMTSSIQPEDKDAAHFVSR